jgi:hypothetical protein
VLTTSSAVRCAGSVLLMQPDRAPAVHRRRDTALSLTDGCGISARVPVRVRDLPGDDNLCAAGNATPM